MTWLLNMDMAGGEGTQTQLDDLEARILALEGVRVAPVHFILKHTLIEVSDKGAEKRIAQPVAKEKVGILVVAE